MPNLDCLCLPRSILVLGIVYLSISPNTALSDVVKLRVENDLSHDSDVRQVLFRIRSEFPLNRKRLWVIRDVTKGATEVNLKSPDRFLVEIDVTLNNRRKYRYESVPMPLKTALERNPNQVLQISTLCSACGNDTDPALDADPALALSVSLLPVIDDDGSLLDDTSLNTDSQDGDWDKNLDQMLHPVSSRRTVNRPVLRWLRTLRRRL